MTSFQTRTLVGEAYHRAQFAPFQLPKLFTEYRELGVKAQDLDLSELPQYDIHSIFIWASFHVICGLTPEQIEYFLNLDVVDILQPAYFAASKLLKLKAVEDIQQYVAEECNEFRSWKEYLELIAFAKEPAGYR